MKQIDYGVMSDRELKQYMLTHREDQEAFNAYLDRRHSRSKQNTIEFDDPASEEKIRLAIQEKLDTNFSQNISS